MPFFVVQAIYGYLQHIRFDIVFYVWITLLFSSLLVFLMAPTLFLLFRNRKPKQVPVGISRKGRPLPHVVPSFQDDAVLLRPVRARWRQLGQNPLLWPLIGYGLASLGFVMINLPGLLPFMLVLLGLMVAYVLYVLTGLLKPYPRLRLTPGHPAPGGAVTLEWWFPRRPERISKLKLVLRGYEKVHRGNVSALEDKGVNLFYEAELLEVAAPEEAGQGVIQVAFPEFVPMTFTTKNQEISWEIHAEWATSYWPDLKNDYSVLVAPGPVIE